MPVQRQVLDVTSQRIFIELPDSFVNHRAELIVLTLDDAPADVASKCRRPHPDIAGKGKTLGDLLSPIVDEVEWECLK